MPKGIQGFQKGHKDFVSPSSRKRQGTKICGENHYLWKGEKASRTPLHRWVSRWKGRPSICEVCGATKKTKYQWANIDHKYRRVLEDFIRMCVSCHRQYDIKNNGYNNYYKRTARHKRILSLVHKGKKLSQEQNDKLQKGRQNYLKKKKAEYYQKLGRDFLKNKLIN